VVTNPESFTPEQLSVYKTESHHVFSVNGVQAAKEHRFTFGLDELPSEVCCYLNRIMRTRHLDIILTHCSSAPLSSNGMNSTSVGLPQRPTDRHHRSHHVYRLGCMSSSPL
jgi:hypothetical protein